MYAIPVNGAMHLRTNDALREYARLEYRREDVHWILASARVARKAPRPRRFLRRLGNRGRPAHAPVACKGSPRRSPEGAPSPG